MRPIVAYVALVVCIGSLHPSGAWANRYLFQCSTLAGYRATLGEMESLMGEKLQSRGAGARWDADRFSGRFNMLVDFEANNIDYWWSDFDGRNQRARFSAEMQSVVPDRGNIIAVSARRFAPNGAAVLYLDVFFRQKAVSAVWVRERYDPPIFNMIDVGTYVAPCEFSQIR